MKRVSFLDKLYYTIQTLVIGFFSMDFTTMIFPYFGGLMKDYSIFDLGIIIVMLIGQLILPAIVQIYMMRHKPSSYYELSDKKFLWLYKGMTNVLPGEIIKLLVCILPFPSLIFGRRFSFIGFMTFISTYCNWFGRYEDVSYALTYNQDWYASLYSFAVGKYKYSDVLGYMVCHVITLIPYITVLMMGYWYLWRKRGKELADMRKVKQKIL